MLTQLLKDLAAKRAVSQAAYKKNTAAKRAASRAAYENPAPTRAVAKAFSQVAYARNSAL